MPFVIGGAIIGGALLSSSASNSAAKKQANAANQAMQMQQKQFNRTTSNLSPWMTGGQVSLEALMQGLGLQQPPHVDWNQYLIDNPDIAASATYASNPAAHYEDWGRKEGRQVKMAAASDPNAPGFGALLKPFGLEDFQASPAYQFNLEEGRKAIDKAAAARGKYYQPSTLQDIARFSQGLASNEFQNAFNNYNTSIGNIYSRLANLSGSGQNAAVQLGGFGAQNAGATSNNLIGAANAQAAGTVGQANALTGGISQGLNAYWMNQVLQRQQNPTYPTSGSNGGGGMMGDFPIGAEGVFA